MEASCHPPFSLKPHVLGACPAISFYIMTIDYPLPNPQVHVSREKLHCQFMSHSLPLPVSPLPSLHEASISWDVLFHRKRLQMDRVCTRR